MKNLNKSTYIHKEKDDPRDRLEVVVGDEKRERFFPRMKIQRWDNEVNFSVGIIDNEPEKGLVTKNGDKIKWEKGDKKVYMYNLPKSDLLPEGGFEYEIILDK